MKKLLAKFKRSSDRQSGSQQHNLYSKLRFQKGLGKSRTVISSQHEPRELRDKHENILESLERLEKNFDADTVSAQEPDVKILRQAVQDGTTPLTVVQNLNAFLRDLFEAAYGRQKDIVLLNEAIKHGRNVVSDCSELDFATEADKLGFALCSKYLDIGSIDALNEAVAFGRLAFEHMTTESQQLDILQNYGYSLSTRYQRLGRIEDLDEAIHCSELAVALAKSNGVDIAMHQANLAARLSLRAGARNDESLRTEVTTLIKEALRDVSAGDPARSTLLSNLSIADSQFKKTGYWQDLEEPIRLCKLALVELKSSSSERLGRALALNNLGCLLRDRYVYTHDRDDLQEALKTFESALQDIGGHLNGKQAILLSYLPCLVDYFDISSSVLDLDTAIQVASKAQSLFTDHSLGLLKILHLSGNIYGHKFIHSTALEDLFAMVRIGIAYTSQHLGREGRLSADVDESNHNSDDNDNVRVGRKLLSFFGDIMDIDPNSIPEKLAAYYWLKLVSSEFKKHFENEFLVGLEAIMDLSTNLEVLLEFTSDESHLIQQYIVESFSFAIKLPGIATVNHRTRILDIQIESGQYSQKPVTIRGLSDIDRLLRERALNHSVKKMDDEAYIYSLVEVAETCRKLYSATKSMDSLLKAQDIIGLAILNFTNHGGEPIDQTVEADQSIKKDDTKAYVYGTMSSMLRDQYLDTGDQDVAIEACRYAEQAMLYSPASNPTIEMIWGLSLKARFRFSGKVHDLDQAIDILRAIDPAASTDLFKSQLANELALMLRIRHMRSGDTNSLEEAITLLRTTLDSSTADILLSGQTYNNLGLCLRTRYLRYNQSEDSEEAIKHLETGLLNPETAAGMRGGLAGNLANCYSDQFKQTHSEEDFEKAVLYAQQAMDLVPLRDSQRFAISVDLSQIMSEKYAYSGVIDDLDKAISQARAAMDLIPTKHFQRVGVARILTKLLSLKISNAPESAILTECMMLEQEAFENTFGMPLDRIQVGRMFARHLFFEGRFGECQSIYEQIVNLLDETDLRWLDDKDRQHVIETMNQLPAEIVAAHLQNDIHVARSLELLERCRTVIMGFSMDNRTELRSKENVHDQDTRRYNQLRMTIDSLAMQLQRSAISSERKSKLMDEHRKHIQELDELISRMKDLPGQSASFLPPSANDLQIAAKNRTIVVVNSCSYFMRSDAIIVTSEGIRSITLTTLKYEDALRKVSEMTTDLVKGSMRTFAERNWKFRETLSWLWTAVAKPVLDTLGFLDSKRRKSLPRITWIGVGILGLLPFHAAGIHTAKSNENIMSYSISSYAPCVRALLYALRQKRFNYMDRKRDARLLIVSSTDKSLLGVREEIRNLQEVAGSIHVTDQKVATTEEVLNQLPLHNLVHFACHGQTDVSDPASSFLLLQEESNEGKPESNAERLTARAIAARPNIAPDLAFLSACSTAQNSAYGLADESLHIASAFQLAGFRHVVGTLWETRDDVCLEVSKLFYKELFKTTNESKEWEAAEALHIAVSAVRARAPETPLLWASFIHLGP